ncbi:MAG: hypothetical protein CMF50_09360 [Legionellales bacterium]|nr:hypothetical protein [Legionellales bacterium]|tara:strand:+ start:34128 stop:34604 length:477 start_codon:yes stop_codon:yes gene_type:complete
MKKFKLNILSGFVCVSIFSFPLAVLGGYAHSDIVLVNNADFLDFDCKMLEGNPKKADLKNIRSGSTRTIIADHSNKLCPSTQGKFKCSATIYGMGDTKDTTYSFDGKYKFEYTGDWCTTSTYDFSCSVSEISSGIAVNNKAEKVTGQGRGKCTITVTN